MNLRPATLACTRSRPCTHYNTLTLPLGVRPFSRTPPKHETHYETLRLPPSATKADLKRQFYALSKETHPDTNPGDAQAAERFSKVSEAYSVLANEDKRKSYDRELQRTHRQQGPGSGTYAGSRPASGLSKRRGTFRGPPPSFYAQGGSNAQREAAERQQAEQTRAGAFNASNYTEAGGWDPGFNSKPVYNTQAAEDMRRRHRKAAEMAAAQAYADEEGAFWGKFIVVSAVIGVGVGIGTLLVNMGAGGGRGGLVRGDGSRREKRVAV